MARPLGLWGVFGLIVFFTCNLMGQKSPLTQGMHPPRNCPPPWRSQPNNDNDCLVQTMKITTWEHWTNSEWSVMANIRSGYLPENPMVPFRGNIMYYEGLGDSMLNHQPLFLKLTEAGFRVIAFDYMGQGGSSGSMNDTRIAQIGTMGDKIWALHARSPKRYPNKNIIGWSTGGLAAFYQAGIQKNVDNIALLAPGLRPSMVVGEQNFLEFKFNQITLKSLTSQTYEEGGVENPHIDPIKPQSPLEAMDFSMNLLNIAKSCEDVSMPEKVGGIVLLSGDGDNYVDAEATIGILEERAPQFTIKQFPRALHEIDNEVKPIQVKVQKDLVNFFLEENPLRENL